MRLLIVGALLALTACASNPIKEALSIESKVGAALYEFTIAQHVESDLTADATVPKAVRKAALEAEIAAKPVRDKVDATLRAYMDLEAKYKAGTLEVDPLGVKPGDQVLAALQGLNLVYAEFVPLLAELQQKNLEAKP